MKPFILGVDLDGVCADYVGAFREYVAIRKGHSVSSIGEATDWEFHKVPEWPIDSREEYLELHHGFVKSGNFVTMRTLPGASEALWRLSDAGIYIRIVTHRLINSGSYSQVISDTAEWLEYRNIPFRGICFEQHKADLGCDLYVDDSPGNIIELRKQGKRTIIFDAPYNRGVIGKRAANWGSVVEMVRGYAQ